jgi:hypothetical protein
MLGSYTISFSLRPMPMVVEETLDFRPLGSDSPSQIPIIRSIGINPPPNRIDSNPLIPVPSFGIDVRISHLCSGGVDIRDGPIVRFLVGRVGWILARRCRGGGRSDLRMRSTVEHGHDSDGGGEFRVRQVDMYVSRSSAQYRIAASDCIYTSIVLSVNELYLPSTYVPK